MFRRHHQAVTSRSHAVTASQKEWCDDFRRLAETRPVACRSPASQFRDCSAEALAEDSARHHIHSEFSVGLNDHDNDPTTPPLPVIAGDAIYAVALNASQARSYGLDWMVQTDHGDPNHSKVNRELAYPALLKAREMVPQLLQFYGMEFDTPAADHSSLIVPKSQHEEESLFRIETLFSKREPWPFDPARDSVIPSVSTQTATRQKSDGSISSSGR